MAYTHDIFISYRRNPDTLKWIKEQFVPLLSLRVGLELEYTPVIYVDEQVESGASWPPLIGAALGESRVLIALWTGNYLASVWCTEELSQMLAREDEAKLRTAKKPNGIIIPAFIHDGESFPPDLQHIKPFEIQNCFNVRMAPNSPRAEELDAALAAQAPAIAHSIQSAPAWRKVWPAKAAAAFYKHFHKHADEQTNVPRFTRRR
jgi:TIR domain-containing protein